MKSRKVLRLLLSFIVLLFVSCFKDEDDNFKLVQKVIETAANGNTETFLYKYNGNQLVTIDGALERTNFTYTDRLITKMVISNKTTQVAETIEYSYLLGKLVKLVSVGNYIIKYNAINDKTILIEKFLLRAGNVEIKEYHGTLQIAKGNLISEERIYDNTPAGEESKYSISYEYDTRKNPFYNITGFKELWNQNDKISVNNNVRSAVITSTTKGTQITSSASLYSNNYKYDADNYPKERVSESTLLRNGVAGYLKADYFY